MRTVRALLVLLAAAAAESWIWQPVEAGGQGSAVQVPIYEYDPTFPKPMSETWAIGPIGGMAVDRAGSSLRRAAPGRAGEHRALRRRRRHAAQGLVLRSRAARARVRSRRRAGAIVGRARAGLRLAAVRARHLRRSQGQRLAGRQRRQGRHAAEVHPGREVPAAVRQARREQGQRRHQQPARPGEPDGGRDDQRGVRRRRLRQQARHRPRRRHAGVQAAVGRVREPSATMPTSGPSIPMRRRPGSSGCRTTSRSRGTASSTWPTVRTTASRSSARTAPT